MTNRLKSYVRRTVLASAREYAYPAKRRTAESTLNAFRDAMRGTDTGWWSDLIYTAPMLDMAHRYREDIATALRQYAQDVGEEFVHHAPGEIEVRSAHILAALLRRKPYTFEEYRSDLDGIEAEAALLGLRFAVEWYAGEVASEMGVEV